MKPRAWLPALLGLCIARLWLAPLPSSFWVDEMATVFVVQHGAADPSFQVAPQVPASVYYVLPRAAQALFGVSEIAYRAPSVLLMGLALLLIARLAQRLIHPDAGWFAAFACLLLREFNYQAADARPYALGTCLFCASLLLLVRWLDSGRWLEALGFVAAAAVLWRVHLLFWPAYAVFAIYTVVRLRRGQSPAGWRQVVAVYGLLALCLAPVLAEAWKLQHEAAVHVVARMPTLADLVKALKPGYILPFAALSAAMARVFRWPAAVRVASVEAVTLIAAWWLCDPLCLFVFSRISGDSVFLERYLYLAIPGIALTATLAAAPFLPSRHWKLMAAMLSIGVLMFQGRWNHLFPLHHNSDWRAAAQAVNREISQRDAAGRDVVVLCPSPFIEARPPVWRPDYPISSFLYSHLTVYPVPGKLYPFPFESSPAAEQFAASLARETLAGSREFLLYGEGVQVDFWRRWLSARPELAGWRVHALGPFADVEVLVFVRGG